MSCFRKRNRNKGFAVVTAIFTSILIAGVMLAMMMTLSADVRRTMKLRDEAQMQQLLLASQQLVGNDLGAKKLTDRESIALPLPGEFSEVAKAEVVGEVISANLATIRVDIKFDQLSRRQTLQYIRENDKWALQSATLEDY